MSQLKILRPRRVPKPKAGAADVACNAAASIGEPTDEQYYGLTARPFSLSSAIPALHRNPAHVHAYESLLAALRRRQGLIVLTGEAGTGKTTVCRAAIDGLDRRTLTAVVPDPSLSREDLLRTLLVEFGKVSVDELTRRNLSWASRVELWHQLRHFLSSLESADPYVVLVIEEAQRLSGPLLDEVHAVSELEVGGVPLQIVLVGRPDLQSHLKTPEMLQLNQRVTTRCQLRSLTMEEVGDYVAHRLAMAGGVPARISFAPEAIEMVHAVCRGVPRLVNVICDRAIAAGHLEQASVIGQSIVVTALAELQIGPAGRPAQPQTPALEVAAAVSERPRGLFEKRPDSNSDDCDLDGRLVLARPSPLFEEDRQAEQADKWVFSSPAGRGHGAGQTGHWNGRGVLRAFSLVAMGMVVVSIAGGFVVTAERAEPPGSAAPIVDESEDVTPAASIVESIEAEDPAAPQGTWAVQVAALKSLERAHEMVAQLTESGFPAFAAESETGRHGLLNVVRVGPFRTPVDAADIGLGLREHVGFHDAFVVHVTAR